MDTVIFSFVSSIIVLFALSLGAWYDITTRTFPKWIWAVCTPVALFTTSVNYFVIENAIPLFATSAILCLFCVIMGYRMGNGGDWRALFYVSLLTPWAAPVTLVLSAIFGLIQVSFDKYRKATVKSAWVVSITVAFGVAMVIYIG